MSLLCYHQAPSVIPLNITRSIAVRKVRNRIVFFYPQKLTGRSRDAFWCAAVDMVGANEAFIVLHLFANIVLLSASALL